MEKKNKKVNDVIAEDIEPGTPGCFHEFEARNFAIGTIYPGGEQKQECTGYA